jgi:hypothetical protein
LLHVHSWARQCGSLAQAKDAARLLEEKESVRWADGYQLVNELAERLADTRLVYVSDREADIYDLFVEAPCPQSAADWLVRAQHDRVSREDADNDQDEGNARTLRQRLAKAPVLTETGFDQPATNGRTARPVHRQIKVARLTLPAPYRPDRKLPDVQITAILATEPHPPSGEDPVEWLLLTNLVVETPAQALEKLSWYLCRWQIEKYFSAS